MSARREPRACAYVRGIIRSKIAPQFPPGPEAALMLAVLRQAVLDLVSVDPFLRETAVTHLQGEIYPAELCGVDSLWVRRVLKEAELL